MKERQKQEFIFFFFSLISLKSYSGEKLYNNNDFGVPGADLHPLLKMFVYENSC